MGERMTWDEIKGKYPDSWVGLVDVEWEDEANISSAVVKYADKSSDELLEMQLRGELISCYTTPDNVFQMGALMI